MTNRTPVLAGFIAIAFINGLATAMAMGNIEVVLKGTPTLVITGSWPA